MTFETAILVVIFIAAAYYAYRLFIKENFSIGCTGKKTGCSCGSKGKSSMQKFLEDERKRRDAETSAQKQGGG